MKIVRINQLEDTERAVSFTGGISFRALVKSDNMGFSLHKTVIPKGGPHHWHYKNHLEACYCIKGKGVIKDLSTGFESMITPDVVYVLDKNDDHTFEALEDTVLISIFNPPVTGNETHGEDGSYELSGLSDLQKAKGIVQIVSDTTNDYDAIEQVTNYLTINK